MTPDRELSSWKEIAGYLGVSIRTAQGWERERGLPVHRLPGGRGRVSVTAAELEEWKRSADERKPVPEDPPPVRPTTHSRLFMLLGVMAAVLLSTVLLLPRITAGTPTSYRVQENSLIILDAEGRELWRKVFPYTLIQNLQPGTQWQFIWFGELEGRASVLVVPNGTGVSRDTLPLICYSARGEERWRYLPGRHVRTSSEDFDTIFGGPNFVVGPIGKGQTAIVAVSAHHLYYPTQVALLSPTGKVLREYWHSGHLQFIRLADLDGDGKNELYLAGVNNAWKAATIVVLDPESFAGASLEPEAPDHQLVGMAPGHERKRVIFARSCLSRRFDPYNTITGFWINGKSLIVETNEYIESPAGLHHHLDPDLREHRVEVSDSYRIRLAQLKAAGQLPPSCTLEEPLSNATVLPPGDSPRSARSPLARARPLTP